MSTSRFPTDHEPRIEIRSATGRFDDFSAVVGPQRRDARGCWCMAYRDSRVPDRDRPGYMRAECATEPGPGVLAYVDDIVVGWCSIAPRASYRRLLSSRTIPVLDDRNAWVAACFVVRAGYRKHGLMHHLLAGAVQHAATCGAEVVEGYPVDAGGGRVDVVSGYVGSVELFERAGFERAAPTTGRSGGQPRWVMRKALR
ncbi:MAG: GNAT family N-acetyltransferase [Jatrophihabitans sp.]